MAPFYGWGSAASRLEPLRGGSLLFTTKFPEVPGTHFIDLGRMKGLVNLFCLNTGSQRHKILQSDALPDTNPAQEAKYIYRRHHFTRKHIKQKQHATCQRKGMEGI